MSATHPQLTRKTIVGLTGKVFDVSVDEILSVRKLRKIVQARYAAALMIREFIPTASQMHVALAIGMTDHTSAMHALVRGATWARNVKDFADKLEASRQAIREWVPAAPRIITGADLVVESGADSQPPQKQAVRPTEPVRALLVRPREADQFSGEWWSRNDCRFRNAMTLAHPERFAAALEAAE